MQCYTERKMVLPCFFTLSALDYHIKTVVHKYGTTVENHISPH